MSSSLRGPSILAGNFPMSQLGGEGADLLFAAGERELLGLGASLRPAWYCLAGFSQRPAKPARAARAEMRGRYFEARHYK